MLLVVAIFDNVYYCVFNFHLFCRSVHALYIFILYFFHFRGRLTTHVFHLIADVLMQMK